MKPNKIITILMFIVMITPLAIAQNTHDPVEIASLITNANSDLISNPKVIGKEVDVAGDLVNLNTKALANQMTVDEVKDELQDIYSKYGLGSQKTGLAWVVVIAACALIAIFLLKNRHKLFKFKRTTTVQELLKGLLNLIKRNYEELTEIYQKIGKNYDEAEKNFKLAEELKKIAEDEEKGIPVIKKSEQIETIDKQLKNLDSWLELARSLLNSTIKISSKGRADVEKVKAELKNEEEILKQYKPALFSAEINSKIEKLKENWEKGERLLQKEDIELLHIIKSSNDLNYGLAEHKKECIKTNISLIEREKKSIRELKKAIKKNDGNKMKEKINDIYNLAGAIKKNLEGDVQVPLYHELLKAEVIIQDEIKASLELMQARETIKRALIAKEPAQIIAEIWEAANKEDIKRQKKLISELIQKVGVSKAKIILAEAGFKQSEIETLIPKNEGIRLTAVL